MKQWNEYYITYTTIQVGYQQSISSTYFESQEHIVNKKLIQEFEAWLEQQYGYTNSAIIFITKL